MKWLRMRETIKLLVCGCVKVGSFFEFKIFENGIIIFFCKYIMWI
jgi:hypothetical protein